MVDPMSRSTGARSTIFRTSTTDGRLEGNMKHPSIPSCQIFPPGFPKRRADTREPPSTTAPFPQAKHPPTIPATSKASSSSSGFQQISRSQTVPAMQQGYWKNHPWPTSKPGKPSAPYWYEPPAKPFPPEPPAKPPPPAPWGIWRSSPPPESGEGYANSTSRPPQQTTNWTNTEDNERFQISDSDEDPTDS